MQKKMILARLIFIFVLSAFALYAQADFTDELDSYNTSLWTKADGWTNGSPFNCYWLASQCAFSGGQLVITINNYSGTPPWTSGEYRSNANYQYGFFECRMKASNHQGVVNSLFTYTGPSAGTIWDEVDIEILGKNPTQMQCNYFANSVGGHEYYVNLGFDASAGFHNYGFEWQSSFIKWYVDGVLVYTANNTGLGFPVTASKLMVNYWNGDSTVTSWLGTFDGSVPQSVYYEWIRYLVVNPYTSATADPTAAPAETAAPTDPPTDTLAPTDAPTVTPAPTATPAPTSVPTATPVGVTADPTVQTETTAPSETTAPGTCTCTNLCSLQTAITVPFTRDGAGEYCYTTPSLGSYVNSWNANSVNINGINCTNTYTLSSSIAAIDGVYYIYYKASYSWSHLEIK